MMLGERALLARTLRSSSSQSCWMGLRSGLVVKLFHTKLTQPCLEGPVGGQSRAGTEKVRPQTVELSKMSCLQPNLRYHDSAALAVCLSVDCGFDCTTGLRFQKGCGLLQAARQQLSPVLRRDSESLGNTAL
ncbi:unnamed protein product [Pleuronectes platessa]|uniref:Uncharacterized protein n=1 Tax=Pleuronectes platessa TaxID=8262 RepID=A0A9N7YWQ5_PLEPL|nr:unnamed protein product [Pleuronectes platessa]